MSVEEDVELRDLIAQTLEKNGCLARIRAELRASMFLALDEDIKISQQEPLQNNKVRSYLETKEGLMMFCIVREFLEFFNLHLTISVYESESYLGTAYNYEGRQKIIQELGLDFIEDGKVPVLQQLLKIAQTKTKNLDINLNINNSVNEVKESSNDNTYTKTDSDMAASKSLSANELKFKSANHEKPVNLNATFDVNSPVTNCQSRQLESEQITKENSRDDTFEGNSSIVEDIATVSNESSSNGTTHPTEDSVVSEKPRLTQRLDKFKAKSSLNSLSDLPPLQINKGRVNDILPSMYSKEFKEKSNLKELDKMFELETEYEEDFISSDDLTLSTSKEFVQNKMDSEKLSVFNKKEHSNRDTSELSSSSVSLTNQNKVKNKSADNCKLGSGTLPLNSTLQ